MSKMTHHALLKAFFAPKFSKNKAVTEENKQVNILFSGRPCTRGADSECRKNLVSNFRKKAFNCRKTWHKMQVMCQWMTLQIFWKRRHFFCHCELQFSCKWSLSIAKQLLSFPITLLPGHSSKTFHCQEFRIYPTTKQRNTKNKKWNLTSHKKQHKLPKDTA